MMIDRLAGLIRFFLLALILSLPTSPALSLTLTGVTTEKIIFTPDAGEIFEIRYRSDKTAKVDLLLYDARDFLLRTVSGKRRKAGTHHLTWDGRDQQGRLVPPEAYRYVLRARDGKGDVVIYDLTDLTGGEPLSLRDNTWDAETGQLRYRLDKAARVAIRVGLADRGPLLNTVVNWRVRPSGPQVESWDGWDSSHVLRLGTHPKLDVAIDAFTLPDNSVLVFSDSRAPGFIERDVKTTGYPRRQDIHQDPPNNKAVGRVIHPSFRIPADQRGDFPLQLSLLGDYPLSAEGLPQISGQVRVRLDVLPKHLQGIASQRFEPVIYIDGRFQFENEVGYFPMTYVWDSKGHNSGTHFMTANLRGYRSNFGMATLKFQVVSKHTDSIPTGKDTNHAMRQP